MVERQAGRMTMKSRLLTAGIVTALLITGGVVIGIEGSPAFGNRGSSELTRFATDQAFQRYLRRLQARQQRHAPVVLYDMAPPMEAPASIALPQVEFEPSAGAPANPAITNNQTFGVDEGG